jgi:RND family efflux transporter MFP subunit
MLRRLAVTFLILLALVAAGAWWWRIGTVPDVRLITVGTGSAAEIVYASGTVEPRDWAKVTSLVTERIVETCDCEGETVPAGHLLVRLDDSRVRATLGELDAQLVLARRELTRAEDLLERSVGSQRTFDEASAALARLDALRAAALKASNDHLITAPIPGQVLRLDASIGEIAQTGEALAYVGEPRPLEILAEVNEEDIPRVAVGQRVLIRSDAFAGRALDGTVGKITPMGDPVQRTYRVRIALPDDTPLFIGMSVDANIVIRETTGNVVIPAVALAGDRVFLVSDGRLVARPLEIGIRGIDSVEVLAGLAAGDRIVSPVPDGASEGMRVREAGP